MLGEKWQGLSERDRVACLAELKEAGVRRIPFVGRIARGDLAREAREPGSVGHALFLGTP